MKRAIIFLNFVFIFFSCRNNEINSEINILNQSFLEVIDTIAYKKFSLRPAFSFNDSINNIDTLKGRKLVIKINDTLKQIVKWKKEIDFYFNQEANKGTTLNEFKKILESKLSDTETAINIENDFKNTGRYLITSSNSINNKDWLKIGEVEFSRVAYDENKKIAAFVVIIKDKKAGIVKLILLRYNDNRWLKFRETTLEIW